MARLDSKQTLAHLYRASPQTVVEVEVPEMSFLMIDGTGDPNTSPAYANAVAALFMVAYSAKFMLRKSAMAVDYAVMPLEALWWAEDMSVFASGDKSRWQWTAMIMQPSVVSQDVIERAIAEVGRKKNPEPLSRLRFAPFAEGRCAQILHVGPFSEEGPTIAKLHEFVDARGARAGKHHEIYLSDIRRAAPAKWKTILRQPLR